MRRKIRRKLKVAKKQVRPSLIGFVLVGLLYDVLRVINGVIAILAWPTRKAEHVIHAQLVKCPHLRWFHNRTIVYIGLGVILMLGSFAFETISNHYAWKCSLEILRAGGACPIWDAISKVTKIAEDV